MCVEQQNFTRRQTLVLGLAALLPIRRNPGASGLRTVTVRPDLSVHPRDSWGAQLPAKGPMEPEPDVRFLLVHHTAGSTNYRADEVVGQIQQVYAYQTGPEKGWPDVCYHFFVDRFGGVWEGRAGSLDGPVVADATGGNQGFAQLVCLLGNFHEQPATAEMVSSMGRVLAWLADRYELDTSPGAETTFVSRGSNKWPEGSEVTGRTISGHRDMSLTVCPGDYLYPLLETEVPTAVQALRSPQRPADANPDEVDVPTTSTSPSTTPATSETSQAPPTPSPPPTSASTSTSIEATKVPLTTEASVTSQVRALTSASDGGPDSEALIGGAVVAGGVIVSVGALAAARRHHTPNKNIAKPVTIKRYPRSGKH
jgi:hypothetical protein